MTDLAGPWYFVVPIMRCVPRDTPVLLLIPYPDNRYRLSRMSGLPWILGEAL